MQRVEVNGECFFVENKERFALLLEEKLGADAADYFRMGECRGECDRTYEIQEHYERVISSAVDELREIKPLKRYQQALDTVIRLLAAEL